jgi:hypothetical protein
VTETPPGGAPAPETAPSPEEDPLLAELFPPAPQGVVAPHSPPPGAAPSATTPAPPQSPPHAAVAPGPAPGSPLAPPPGSPPQNPPPGTAPRDDPAVPRPVWGAPTQPVEDLPHDEYYARRPVTPPATEPAWQQPSIGTSTKRSFPVALVVIAILVAVGLGFAATKLFFNGEPFVYTGADGEVSRVAPKKLLRPLVGYQYQEIPRQTIDQMIELVRAQSPQDAAALEEGLLRIDARQISQGGVQVGGVIVMAIEPEMMADRGERASAIDELQEQFGDIERVEMGDKVAYLGSRDTTSFAVSFYENLLVMVLSPSEGTAKTLANELLTHAP